MVTSRVPVVLLLLAATQFFSCDSEPPTAPPSDRRYPAPTSPENVLAALQAIYSDVRSSTTDRMPAYADLLVPQGHPTLPAFLHECIAPDSTIQDSWGLEEELSRARDLFEREESGDIYVIDLLIEHDPPLPADPDPPEYTAMSISATRVTHRVMFNPSDGFLVGGGTADFLVVEESGRWSIAEWREVTRALGNPRAGDPPLCAFSPIE